MFWGFRVQGFGGYLKVHGRVELGVIHLKALVLTLLVNAEPSRFV